VNGLLAGRMLVCWPIAALRRYGVNNVSFTIVTGRSVNVAMVCQVSLVPLRNCSTGEGKFQFFTQQSRRIYNHLHSMAVTKAANKTQPLYRSGSEAAVHGQASPAGSQTDHSPPQPTASEDYSRLNWPTGTGAVDGTCDCSHSTSTLC
jgi:hypothetical protein